MQGEKKYGFKYKCQPIELSLQQLQTILDLLDYPRDNYDYISSLLQLWQDKYLNERKNESEHNYQKQLEQERKQEYGDD